MAKIQPVIRIEIDPAKPVQEVCTVISAITPYHVKEQEPLILRGIMDAVTKRLNELKGAEASEQVREPRRNEENQG